MLKWIDLPPVWLVGFAALTWMQARFLPIGGFGPWAPPLGALLILAGVVLAAAAVVEFHRHRTTVIPHQMPSAIVTTGVFARTRNPIYLGDTAILLGCVLWWQAVPSTVLVPVFMILISKRFIAAEEARLHQEFPSEFQNYKTAVRRWL
ncbi:MAG: isoprenylcysteine carboxylmethyltransferase family protein [Pseudomonadota bacterium]